MASVFRVASWVWLMVCHERTGRFGCRDLDLHVGCCAGDGGGPSGTALQGEVPNRRMLLRSGNGVVVSDAEKAQTRRQVWAGKANASEPLMRRRKDLRWHRNQGPVSILG